LRMCPGENRQSLHGTMVEENSAWGICAAQSLNRSCAHAPAPRSAQCWRRAVSGGGRSARRASRRAGSASACGTAGRRARCARTAKIGLKAQYRAQDSRAEKGLSFPHRL
jgi:hypothetical protein